MNVTFPDRTNDGNYRERGTYDRDILSALEDILDTLIEIRNEARNARA